nr:CcmD family protein [uncultured Dyadobacter sp.]
MKAFSQHISKLLLLLSMLLPLMGHAQSQGPVSDLLRQDGKLWVVVTVIFIVFTGLFYYLFRTNQRINRLKNRR